MASCGTCARGTCDVPLARDTTVEYHQGDVYSLQESVYTPIYDILVHTFSRLGDKSDTSKRSQRSLNDFKGVPNHIRGGRPAVIMEDDDGDNPLGLMVCVATTYSGEPISKLPHIFQHFSIEIAPNHRPSTDRLCHLHGLPEWDRENAWLIGWPFRSTATCEGAWTSKPDGQGDPQVFGMEAMKFLAAECRKRWKDWWDMCEKDPGLPAVFEAELRKHIDDRKRQFYGGGRSKTSSYDSLTTGVNSASWRSTMCSTTTIPEEPENDGVLGALKNQDDAGEWKVVGKPGTGTGSTYSLASTVRRKRKGASDTDTYSTKATRSQISLAKKQRNGSGVFNFDILRAVRVK